MTIIRPIPLSKFSDKLLLNALGEEPRILNSVLKRIEKGITFDDIPEHFTLGTGHLRYFFNRCKWIYKHYLELRSEYYNRFNKHYSKDHLRMVTERYQKIFDLKPYLCNDWLVTKEAEEMVLERMLDRSKGYDKHYYYGSIIDSWDVFLFSN